MALIFAVYYLFLLVGCVKGISNKVLRLFSTFFIGYMGVSIVISQFNPYGLKPVSVGVYLLFTLGVTSFALGLKFCVSRININNKQIYVSDQIDKLVNNKLFLLIIVICDLFVMYLSKKQAALLIMYTAMDMRENLDELLFEGNSILGLGFNMVIAPMGTIITMLGAYLLIYRIKMVVPLFLTLVYIVFSSMLDGSRGGIFTILLYGVMLFSFKDYIRYSGSKQSSKKLIAILSIVGVLVFITMCNMTAHRMYGATGFSLDNVMLGMDDMAKQFVTYSVGPFRALDFSLQTSYVDILGGHTFGRCTLGFIDGMLSLILNKIGIIYSHPVSVVSSYLQNNWIDIGGTYFNFAYTAFYFFYHDFGVIGVFVIPLIFAFSIKKVYSKFFSTGNMFFMLLSLYLSYVALYMIFSWGLYRHTSFMVILYIWLFNKFFYSRLNN